MTGFLVVRDDDTLRDRLAQVIDQHPVVQLEKGDGHGGYRGSCLGCAWSSEADGWNDAYHRHVADAQRAVLRDVGTPATAERREAVGSDAEWHRSIRLVTDWTAETGQPT